MSEKKIRVTLEDDVSGKIGRIGQSAADSLEKVAGAYDEIDSLVDGLIQDSEKYNLSIKERVRWVEKEIQTLQRTGSIDNRDRKSKLDFERRLGQEKHTWTKKDEDNYRKRRGWNEQERRDETLYYEKAKARLKEKESLVGGNKGRFKARFEEYLQDAQGLDRRGGRGGGDDGGDGNDGGNGRRGGGFGSRIGNAARAAGNGALAAAGFGAVLSVAGFVGKLVDEARQLDQNRKKLGGATGVTGVGGAAFGLKEAELMDYTRTVSIARGMASKTQAKEQLGMEKAFGMDIGSTNQFNKVLRADHSTTLVDSTVDMLNIMKKSDLYNIKRNDFSQLHELLDRGNALNELQASQTEEISARNSSGLMAALGKVGGRFGDFRQVQTITGMNQAITDPNNDFKQAFLFRTLRQQNPNASFLDMKMKQEEGIFGKGTLSGLMGNLSKTFNGEQLTFSISKMLGLNLHSSKKLQEHYNKNPTAFDNMSFDDEGDFKAFIESGQTKKQRGANFSKKSIKSKGESNTGAIEGWSSEFDTWMGRKGDKAVQYVKEMQVAYEKGGVGGIITKLASDVANATFEGIRAGFAALGNPFTNVNGAGMGTEAPPTQQYLNNLKRMKTGGNGLIADYNAAAFQSVARSALGNVPEEQLGRYSSISRAVGTRYGNFQGAQINPVEQAKNTGAAKAFNELMLELLNKFSDQKGKFKIDKTGEIMKVEIVNKDPKQPKNTVYKSKSN